MVYRFLVIFILSNLLILTSKANIIYEKNNIVITNLDLDIYQNLYQSNFNKKIDDDNALKNLILISNVINDLKNNNPEFINRIDNEILVNSNQELLQEEVVKNFFRFLRIRNEFVINYFQNKLTVQELKLIFQNINSLDLPISDNNCLIVNTIIDLKSNHYFIENFFSNLKNNEKNFKVLIENKIYDVCVNEQYFKQIEQLIINYIQNKTKEDFEIFVYDKSKN